jgi:hypothetical protein
MLNLTPELGKRGAFFKGLSAFILQYTLSDGSTAL